jgi:hypothetical protein
MKVDVNVLESFPDDDLFHHDEYNMGHQIGKDLWLMYKNHDTEICGYLILVDQKTGQRVQIDIDQVSGQDEVLIGTNLHSTRLEIKSKFIEKLESQIEDLKSQLEKFIVRELQFSRDDRFPLQQFF